MSAKSQLLSTPAEATEVRLFPAGDYICQIVEADVLGGFWKATENRPQARWFQSYVPTLRILDYLRSGDPQQDERTAAQRRGRRRFAQHDKSQQRGPDRLAENGQGHQQFHQCQTTAETPLT